MSRVALGLACLVGLLALAAPLALSSPVRAGERPLELLLVNMAPEGTPDGCMRDVARVLRADHDVNVARLGGERVRQLTHHDRDASDFTTWQREELEPVVRVMRQTIDAIALVSCREDEGRADLWIAAPSGGVARVHLTRARIDASRAEWIGQTILFHAWTGFVP